MQSGNRKEEEEESRKKPVQCNRKDGQQHTHIPLTGTLAQTIQYPKSPTPLSHWHPIKPTSAHRGPSSARSPPAKPSARRQPGRREGCAAGPQQPSRMEIECQYSPMSQETTKNILFKHSCPPLKVKSVGHGINPTWRRGTENQCLQEQAKSK